MWLLNVAVTFGNRTLIESHLAIMMHRRVSHRQSRPVDRPSIGEHRPRTTTRHRGLTSLATSSSVSDPQPSGEARSHTTDVLIIGSGIGGLSCGGLLAKYGLKVRAAG